MEPDGDPEARIRELEQTLADRARSSELGTRPYGSTGPTPPYPPSPQHYGAQYGSESHAPYYSRPQRVVHKRSASLTRMSLVLGFISAAIVGAIVFGRLADQPRGGSVNAPQVDPPAEALTVGAGDTLSLSGIEQDETVVCNQGTVNVGGMKNTIEIAGDCAAVSVSGMNNVVTVKSAVSIGASGFDNRVTYRTGAPEITTSGSGNVIEQG